VRRAHRRERGAGDVVRVAEELEDGGDLVLELWERERGEVCEGGAQGGGAVRERRSILLANSKLGTVALRRKEMMVTKSLTDGACSICGVMLRS
jgi:hypothetical protein